MTGPPTWWRAILPANPWERRNSRPGTAPAVYRVLHASAAQTRLDVAATRGLTPLVGRASEVALLQERWGQVKDGMGHVVVLSGEAGIGKSRLVQVLKEHVAGEAHTRWECRCSPYYQHTALYPIIDLLNEPCDGSQRIAQRRS